MRILVALMFIFLILFSCISAQEVEHISIKAGCDDSYPPYEFSENAQATGFNIELITGISKIMGFDLSITPGPWNQVRKELEKGSIDMITGMYYSMERSQDFSFSFPFLTVTHSLFMHKDGQEITDFDGITGKKVAVQQGDIMHDYLKNREMQLVIVAVENPTTALRYVQEKKVDYALISKLQGEYLIRENRFDSVKSTGPSILPRDYCFAVRKGNESLLNILNEGLSIAKKTGVYDEIYSEWFIKRESELHIFDDRYFIAVIIFLAFLSLFALFSRKSMISRIRLKDVELKNIAAKNEGLKKDIESLKNSYAQKEKIEKVLYDTLYRLYKTTEYNLAPNISHTFRILTDILHLDAVFIFAKDDENSYNCLFDCSENPQDKYRFIAEHSVKPSGYLHAEIERGETFRLKSEDFISDIIPSATNPDNTDIPKDNLILYPLFYGNETKGFMLIKLTHEQIANSSQLPEQLIKPFGQAVFNTITRIKESKKIMEANESLEKKVRERTQELEKSLEMVKITQQQLYESEKFLALGSLIGGISHEINTPLGNSITVVTFLRDLFGELISENSEKSAGIDGKKEEIDESLKILYENLKQIIQTVGRFKQIANDQNYEKARSFNIKEYIEDIIITMKSQMLDKDIDIRLICPDDVEIIGYPGNYYRIFSNLISNSIIHGFERSSSGKIGITVKPEGKSICIEYTDNGIGIKEENIKRIFDPFFSTKGGAAGSGMGLNIVYNLVKRSMGGEINCESSIGRGAKFIIKLPV